MKRRYAYVLGLIGLWLINAPFVLPYKSDALKWSDVASGLLVVIFSGMSLRVRRLWPQWAIVGVALWLLAAPLLFWAPRMSIYLNDTIVSLLLMTFAIILPYATPTEGPAYPKNWTYNPSAWSQRWPIVILGFLAFIGATYLAFYQLGYIDEVWDPFFGDGTKRVLESKVAEAFPVSDAGLGALAYVLECVSGLVGDTRRWRTMPWMSFLFWVLVVPAGIVSTILVFLQPLVVGAWCTLCLITAALTLATIPPAMDEFMLTLQFLRQSKREGKNVFKIFWFGEVYYSKL